MNVRNLHHLMVAFLSILFYFPFPFVHLKFCLAFSCRYSWLQYRYICRKISINVFFSSNMANIPQQIHQLYLNSGIIGSVNFYIHFDTIKMKQLCDISNLHGCLCTLARKRNVMLTFWRMGWDARQQCR